MLALHMLEIPDVPNRKFLIKTANDCAARINGQYVPARPLPFNYGSWFCWLRLKDAWEVFRGRADAVKWIGQ
jgi:hypothetical protein